MLLVELFENKVVMEGGNVFKNQTQTINKADVAPTVQWLEQYLGISLLDKMLGSTGKKEVSGDIDLAVDSKKVGKPELVKKLEELAKKLNLDPASCIRRSGMMVHFCTPIAGNPKKGFVQTDFLFTDDVEWTEFMAGAEASSQFKGVHRAQLLASIAKGMGFKVSPAAGLVSRVSNKVITKDPDYIAQILLGSDKTADDLKSVESMLAALEGNPDREKLIQQAKETWEKTGMVIEDIISEAPIKKKTFDTEHYGNWTVDMSIEPVHMQAITGNEKKFVARVRHKRKEDLIFYGAGSSQAEARERAIAAAKDRNLRPEDPDKFTQFNIDLNINFTREYFNPKSGGWFSFSKNDNGDPILIMANSTYAKEFGHEMRDLGFTKAANRVGKQNTDPLLSFSITRNMIKKLGLIPNMRYTLDLSEPTEDGHETFIMKPDTRTEGPQDKYRMNYPGLTLAAGGLRESVDVRTPSLENIAKKHNVSLESLKKQLQKGIKVELEHTKSKSKAAEIARDHLNERPDYYTKLTKMEKEPVKEKAYQPPAPGAQVKGKEKAKKTKNGEHPFKGRLVGEEDSNPCWDGYKQIGMKKKGNKKVPNCVPKK